MTGPVAGRGLLLLVAAAFFMENLDATIVTTAAPAIAHSLRVEASDVGVTITAYLVTVAAVIPASGWVTGRWGARRTFAVAVVLFTAASGACALCQTLPELTVARIVQAVGGALMVPVGRLTVFRSTDRRDLVRVVAWMTWPALVAPVVAPLVGGVIVTYLSWPWIFAVNIPLGVVALAVTGRLIPKDAQDPGRRLDLPGLLLTATALGTLVFAAEATSSPGAQRWLLIGICTAVALVLGAWSVRHLARVAEPLVDLRSLRIRTFRVPHAGGSLFRAAVFAVPFLLALEFQNGFHWSPVRSGTFVMFVFVGNLTVKPATTRILRRFGFRRVLIVSVMVCAASMALTGALGPTTPIVLIAGLLIVGGAARSVGFTAYNTIALADVQRDDIPLASTLSSSLQQLAQGLGVALAALALRAGAALSGSSTTAVTSFRIGFVIIAVVCATALFDAARLPSSAGALLVSRDIPPR